MKKYLLGALALPLAFAACTNDDFESINNNESQALNGETIELPENFALVGAKQNADTRAGMINRHIGWFPVAENLDATTILDEKNWDHIGLAWAGTSNDGKVYTNYDFTHYGWLYNGETEPNYDKCNDNVLTNGVWFTGNATPTDQFKNAQGNVTDFWDSSNNIYKFNESAFQTANVGENRGLFRTSFGTIFGGNYLVYYPYNPDLKDIDYLKAISPSRFTNANNKVVSINATYNGDYMSALAPELFNIGRTSIEGGTQAAEFELHQLSGMIGVDVRNESGVAINNITSVALYAKKGGFYTSVSLDANKIATKDDVAKGAALYVNDGKAETTATLISTAADASNGVNLKDDTYTRFTFAALPTTIDEYIVIVQDKDGNSYADEGSNLVIPAGAWADKITITLTKALSSAELYAYDEASFATALAKANAFVGTMVISLLLTC